MDETKKNYIILPGNPPSKFFYSQWQNELQTLLPKGNFTYLDYPNLSHSCSVSYFQAVVKHTISKITEKYPNQKINLIGHSFGGYMATQIMQNLADEIEKCVLIFPFLGAPRVKGKAVLHFASLVEKTPPLKNKIISHKNILSHFWPELKKIHDEELNASTQLAHHEKIHFMKRIDHQIPEVHHSKIHLIYNPADTWCPPKTINKLREQHKASYTNSKHDFVICPDERKKINKLMQNIFC